MFKNIEDVQNLGKDQIETITAMSANLTKEFQKIAAETADYTKKSVEGAAATAEKLMNAKSIETAVQIQTDFAKAAYEDFAAQSKTMGELYMSLAKDSFKPFEGAIAKAAEATKASTKAPAANR